MSKPPEKTDADAAPAGKSKKKLIIMIVAGVLGLALIGGGAAIFLAKKNANKDKDKEHKEEPAHAPVFLPLEAFVVNLQNESGDKYLQISMTLQVSDEEQVSLIKLNMPQVRSRILMLLSSKEADELLTSDGKAKLVEDISNQVNLPFTSSGKPQKVSSVFFTSFVIQ